MTSDASQSSQDITFGSADPFVIAEIGVNHDGDPARAEALVDAASEAGAAALEAVAAALEVGAARFESL